MHLKLLKFALFLDSYLLSLLFSTWAERPIAAGRYLVASLFKWFVISIINIRGITQISYVGENKAAKVSVLAIILNIVMNFGTFC